MPNPPYDTPVVHTVVAVDPKKARYVRDWVSRRGMLAMLKDAILHFGGILEDAQASATHAWYEMNAAESAFEQAGDNLLGLTIAIRELSDSPEFRKVAHALFREVAEKKVADSKRGQELLAAQRKEDQELVKALTQKRQIAERMLDWQTVDECNVQIDAALRRAASRKARLDYVLQRNSAVLDEMAKDIAAQVFTGERTRVIASLEKLYEEQAQIWYAGNSRVEWWRKHYESQKSYYLSIKDTEMRLLKALHAMGRELKGLGDLTLDDLMLVQKIVSGKEPKKGGTYPLGLVSWPFKTWKRWTNAAERMVWSKFVTAAQQMVEKIREQIPKRTGKLRRSVRVEAVKGKPGQDSEIKIVYGYDQIQKGQAYYASLVEYGGTMELPDLRKKGGMVWVPGVGTASKPHPRGPKGMPYKALVSFRPYGKKTSYYHLWNVYKRPHYYFTNAWTKILNETPHTFPRALWTGLMQLQRQVPEEVPTYPVGQFQPQMTVIQFGA